MKSIPFGLLHHIRTHKLIIWLYTLPAVLPIIIVYLLPSLAESLILLSNMFMFKNLVSIAMNIHILINIISLLRMLTLFDLLTIYR